MKKCTVSVGAFLDACIKFSIIAIIFLTVSGNVDQHVNVNNDITDLTHSKIDIM